ncbi:hypothetical protein GCM10025863_27950 [Microbacterium suwonense]|uniref:HTH marR-type domain-containing protein n=1 Tax=Microbacterium suwonense TaxID=683047 RepID=A0ABM8FWT9_9MICO|nr:hypothetical protein GCM10025863_27950 [Microbacterium suwonense]
MSHAVFRVARLHKSLAARLLRETGLRPGQELVLMALWRDGPQRLVDLVRRLESDAPSMTRSIARLEKAGLVQRQTSATDRRAVIVEATPRACRCVSRSRMPGPSSSGSPSATSRRNDRRRSCGCWMSSKSGSLRHPRPPATDRDCGTPVAAHLPSIP